jgi:dTMP kinase
MYYYNSDVDVVIFSRYILAVMYLPDIVNTITYKIVSFILPTSDCMFFLDITPEESLRRIGSRHEQTEMFENIDSLRENRQRSTKFTYNWNVVSADDAPEVISQKIVEKCMQSE